MSLPITLVWLRRDLRLFDHTALQTAIRLGRPLAAVFVFDRDIIDDLPADDRRLSFIHESISEMQAALHAKTCRCGCCTAERQRWCLRWPRS